MNDVVCDSTRFFLLPLLCCIAGCSHRVEGPRAIIEPSEVSIETSSSDEENKIEFRIRNIGSESFNVMHVSASCGCTSAEVHPKTIDPGGEAILTATVRPMNSGTLRIAVEAVTDIPGQSTLTVFINNKGKGKVPYISSNSDLITFGTNAKLGDIESFFVETRESASDKPWINPPMLELDGVEVRGGLANEAPVGNNVVSRRYEYQARIASDLEYGEFRSQVVVTGQSGTAHQEIRIPLQGSVAAPVQVSPGAVFGTFSKFEEIPEYVISFQNTQHSTQMNIETHTADPKRYDIVKLAASNGLVTFRLRFPENFGTELVDELVFRTGVAEMPEIRLPVRLRIRE